MKIRVLFKDGTDRHVTPQALDRLLEDDRVLLFQRKTGWVVVGHDPVRARCRQVYRGPERRDRCNGRSGRGDGR